MRWSVLPSVVAVLAVAHASSGCRSLTESRVRFDVDPSGLDYVQMLYVPGPRDGVPLSLNLDGRGYASWEQGRSARVVDHFSTDVGSEHWHDVRRRNRVLSVSETRAVFQRLVDLGVFDDGVERPEPSTIGDSVAVVVRHGYKRAGFRTSDRNFLQVLWFIVGRSGHLYPSRGGADASGVR